MKLQHRLNDYWNRLVLLYQMLPVLWHNSRDWDACFGLNLMRHHLKSVLQQVENDKHHQDAPLVAGQIRRFLDLLNVHENAEDLIPKPPGADLGGTAYNSEGKLVFLKPNDAGRDYFRRVEQAREKAWEEAWRLYKDKSRGWGT